MTRLATLFLLLAACTSSSSRGGHVCDGHGTTPPERAADDAPPFAGLFSGTLTSTVGGVDQSQPAVLTVHQTGKNQLSLVDVCLGGVPAVVTGPLAFDAVCYECLPVTTADCASLVVGYDSGAGTLSADGTTIDVSLSATGTCSDGTPDRVITQAFTGTRVQAAQARVDGAAASDFAAAAGR